VVYENSQPQRTQGYTERKITEAGLYEDARLAGNFLVREQTPETCDKKEFRPRQTGRVLGRI
jgi:hypothetical protein